MNETKKEIRERRKHREMMDKYVFEPSRDYAIAFSMFGLGLGLAIFATYAAMTSKLVGGFLFAFAIMLLFGGYGWQRMIDERLDAYYWDVMQPSTEEKTIMSTFEDRKPLLRVIPDRTGKPVASIFTDNQLHDHEWRKVAIAIRQRELRISQTVLAKNRETKVISQSKYNWFYQYMTKNGHLVLDGNENRLTESGERLLDRYLSPTPDIDTDYSEPVVKLAS